MSNAPIEGEIQLLPWEHPSGEPRETGICLSGGGLRAASFSLGALQVLQEERGLLYGPEAADYLAVVSGGSYVSAAHVLSAATEERQTPAPLAEGAPETEHVTSRGRYLIEDGLLRTGWRFGSRLVINFVIGIALLCWITLILSIWIAIADRSSLIVWPEPFRAASVAVFFAALGVLFRSTITDKTARQYVYAGLGLGALVASAPSLLFIVLSTPPLTSADWWRSHPAFAVAAAILFLSGTAVSSFAALGYRVPGLARDFSEIVTRNAPRVLGAIALCFGMVAFQPWINDAFDESLDASESGWALAALFGILLGGLITYVPGLASIHRVYRDLLSRCFGVRRGKASDVEAIIPPTEAKLSMMIPSSDQTRFPRLLICATANVRRRIPGQRRWASVAPFVFSHDRSGLVGVPGAAFETEKLELGRQRAGLVRRYEPEISLMGAVAMTGAAIAPSMGSKTIAGLTPFFALINARLGVWMPNPLSRTRRQVVSVRPDRPSWWSRHRQEYGSFGPGFDALVSEFFGIHPEDSRRIFLTDGGHYDNLGLLSLLRARCETIWCVDAYHGRRHLGRQLERVIELAESELSVTIELDTRRFDLEARKGKVAKNAVAVGTIQYPGARASGKLIVIKLALTPDAPSSVQEYSLQDKRFPYHPTTRQWFSPNRFRQYQRLGRHAASLAIEKCEAASDRLPR